MRHGILFLLTFFIVTSNYGQTLEWHKFAPSSPLITDTIQAEFLVSFNDHGGRKLGGVVSILQDTIVYTGCYFCPCVQNTPSEVYDTLRLPLSSSGSYKLIVIAQYALTNLDTTCSGTNTIWNDTIDTFFIVNEPNAIIENRNYPFCAALLNKNTVLLQTESDTAVDIHVLDVNGCLVYRKQGYCLRAGNNSIDIDIPDLPAGLYFYQLQVGDRVKLLKWMQP